MEWETGAKRETQEVGSEGWRAVGPEDCGALLRMEEEWNVRSTLRRRSLEDME